MTEHTSRVDIFRDLHTKSTPLVLVNAWDAASARVIEAAGAPAIATTSAGVAWSLGAPDGDALGRRAAVDLIERVVATVTVPVTADIESGYGADPDEVADTVRAVIAAGAAGVNIEDAWHGGATPLRSIEDQTARLAAARRAADGAGVPLFLNARIDTYLSGTGGVAESIERARAYLAAGADGVFVPGISAPADIIALVAGVSAPVNVMAVPGLPSVAGLAELGVARVSLGSAVAQAAYAVARRAAVEAYGAGTWESTADALEYGELNALLRR